MRVIFSCNLILKSFRFYLFHDPELLLYSSFGRISCFRPLYIQCASGFPPFSIFSRHSAATTEAFRPPNPFYFILCSSIDPPRPKLFNQLRGICGCVSIFIKSQLPTICLPLLLAGWLTGCGGKPTAALPLDDAFYSPPLYAQMNFK